MSLSLLVGCFVARDLISSTKVTSQHHRSRPHHHGMIKNKTVCSQSSCYIKTNILSLFSWCVGQLHTLHSRVLTQQTYIIPIAVDLENCVHCARGSALRTAALHCRESLEKFMASLQARPEGSAGWAEPNPKRWNTSAASTQFGVVIGRNMKEHTRALRVVYQPPELGWCWCCLMLFVFTYPLVKVSMFFVESQPLGRCSIYGSEQRGAWSISLES